MEQGNAAIHRTLRQCEGMLRACKIHNWCMCYGQARARARASNFELSLSTLINLRFSGLCMVLNVNIDIETDYYEHKNV
jgi:hypothetical protein